LSSECFNSQYSEDRPEFTFDGVDQIRIKVELSGKTRGVMCWCLLCFPLVSTSSDGVLKTPDPPLIEEIEPLEAAPGDWVTVTGWNFDTITSIQLGDVEVKEFSLAPWPEGWINHFVFRVPSHARDGPLTVVTPFGEAVSEEIIRVRLVPPEAARFTPTSGPPGTRVTISGARLSEVNQVLLGAVEAQLFLSFLLDDIDFEVPLGAETGPITVISPHGAFTTEEVFAVTDLPAPTISSLFPMEGDAGTEFSINGRNFIGAINVRVNGISADYTLESNYHIRAKVPPGAMTGPIAVETSAGMGQSSALFRVVVPEASYFWPVTGTWGTSVIVRGDLSHLRGLLFNGTSAVFSTLPDAVRTSVPAGATTGPIIVRSHSGETATSDVFTIRSYLPVTIVSAPHTAVTDEAFEARFRVANESDFDVREVELIAEIPGTGLVMEAASSAGSFEVEANFVRWSLPELAAGGTVEIKLTLEGASSGWFPVKITAWCGTAIPSSGQEWTTAFIRLAPPGAGPVLFHERRGPFELVLFWPIELKDWRVEMSESPGISDSWEVLNLDPVESEEWNSVELIISPADRKFFRLFRRERD
jgi:hypothetical protein